MKILELNQESFSLKNIILKFDELNHNEMISLQKKLYRNGSLTRLAPDSLLVVLTIDDLAKLINLFENDEDKNIFIIEGNNIAKNYVFIILYLINNMLIYKKL